MEIKEAIYQELHIVLSSKIDDLKKAIANIKESRDKETKSSMGDKYETGRAMAQIEMDQVASQLLQTENQWKELLKIDATKQHDLVGLGSLVKTNQANYFLSIGYGEVKLNGENYFCLSMNSPVGKLLSGKQKGDQVEFRGNKIEIVEVN